MIVRGTTPYHNFIVPFSTSDVSELYITYLQNGETIIEKSLSDVEITDVDPSTSNGFITDQNKGDSFITNNSDYNEEEEVASELTVHLTQEDTLGFKFWPAAEKNIAVIQIRVLTSNGEAFASEPIRERIYGILKDGVIGNGQGQDV